MEKDQTPPTRLCVAETLDLQKLLKSLLTLTLFHLNSCLNIFLERTTPPPLISRALMRALNIDQGSSIMIKIKRGWR